MSSINSPAYPLSKELARILSPLVGWTCYTVKNLTHFVNLLAEIEIEKEEKMVSFDVTSLFTKVPIQDALEVMDIRSH